MTDPSQRFQLIDYQLCRHGQPLFAPLQLTLEGAETAAITGPSGSGKSTLFSDLAGVLAPAFQRRGQVCMNGIDITPLAIEERQIGLLFQDDLLFPHLNVAQNLSFAVPKKYSREERIQKIEQALAEAELNGFQQRDIATLSGGQRSRIAVLRTLLSEPKLILLDEPFSKLDPELRSSFRDWVFEHLAEHQIPALLVTHDLADIPADGQHLQLEVMHAG